MSNLVSVRDLHVSFRLGKHKIAEAVRGISFDVPENSTVALVGESGSGKSVSAMAIVQLLPENAIVGPTSRIEFDGRNVLTASDSELRAIRGNDISVVFQEPMTSLNPVFTVGWQIAEVLKLHTDLTGRALNDRIIQLLNEVGIPEPEGARRCVSARAVGRPAAARDDRDGDRLRAEAADRRRADHRARRHHPAADPRADRAAADEATG